MDNYLLSREDWDNRVRWKPGERLHHLFEQRCDKFEEEGDVTHLAVDSAEGQLSYRELDQSANQLANHLLSKGYGPGDVIGLLLDKSARSYIAMLAVMKINAVYVPMDPSFPADRIAYIAGDAGIKAIVTLSAYLQLIDEAGLPATCMDTESKVISEQRSERLTEEETGKPVNELSYIIYTSGSTGRPKGVPIEQASICNFIRVAAELYGYSSQDRVYQGLTIAFDFAVEEILVPLVVGATLLPNQTGSSLLGSDLAEFLRENRATAMCCVPTLLATIDQDLPDLRLLIVSGEACPQDLIERWYTPKRVILNAYGPTEATVTATLAFSKPGEEVTIGKPLPTYTVVILEPGTNTVLPFGEEGEIAIAGVGVAKGYLNRDDQTKKAFIKDFLNIPNNSSGLIYRTGDLGVINQNGDIEYRGRIDLQVKIRGYRIELTEIESVILQVPQIAQAVVDTFEPSPGVMELVAYYTVKRNAESFSQDLLIETLRQSLPSYMVPAYYERLEVMPMMASDKADRKALPRPSGQRMHGSEREYVAPRTAEEERIAQVLQTVLGIDLVSAEGDFFTDYGASSLLIAQFSAALRKELKISNISLQDIYAQPTVALLAQHLSKKRTEKQFFANKVDFRIPQRKEYILCGSLQLLTYFGFFFVGIELLVNIVPWLLAATGMFDFYLRSSLVLLLSFVGWTTLVIAAKWLLVGRWVKEQIPIWSIRYFRFWFVKLLVVSSPMELFKGYPLYNMYLRLMGARIGHNVVFNSKFAPVCADLLAVGDDSILHSGTKLTGYKAKSNYIFVGPIIIGKNVIVGEGSSVDINTVMEDGSQLGHASALLENQTVAKGKKYHGVPAQETGTDFTEAPEFGLNVARPVLFSVMQVLALFCGIAPLVLSLVYVLVISYALPRYDPLTLPWALDILAVTATAFLGFFLLAILFVVAIPRLLYLFLEENRIYRRLGLHHFVFDTIRTLSNSSSFNLLFGDSSFIVHYLKLLGYKLGRIVQTGSNFGLEHGHDIPYLCEFGQGSMISDGFVMINLSESCTAFRVSRAVVEDGCFVGNNVYYPPNAKVGKNCLIATKAMVPIAGEARENVGVLGSPSFEIPLAAAPGGMLDPFSNDEEKERRLRKKTASNFLSIIRYLSSSFIYFYVVLLLIYSGAQLFGTLGGLSWLIVANSFLVFSIGYAILLERSAYGFRRMKPIICSMYDTEYWNVERVWKFSESFLRWIWLGTPFRSLINRALGVTQGKMVYDDGLYVSEKTMVIIGDYCNFNRDCVLQAHSLEQGVYKSDYIAVGDQCTLEGSAFVHYGVKLEDGVTVGMDAFVMKGESADSDSIWQGNPARAI